MRKMMTKEVTMTTVKPAKIEMVDGIACLKNLEPVTLLGNVRAEKAQKEVNKFFGEPVTILELIADTITYEMAVEDFIKIATIRSNHNN
jgi:hypothetical protein